MNIARELNHAWQIYQSHISFKGYDSPVCRMVYRVWLSLKRAMDSGMREPIALSLCSADFERYCECLVIDPACVKQMGLQLTEGLPIRCDDGPYSFFWGHDRKGKLKHYALAADWEEVTVTHQSSQPEENTAHERLAS